MELVRKVDQICETVSESMQSNKSYIKHYVRDLGFIFASDKSNILHFNGVNSQLQETFLKMKNNLKKLQSGIPSIDIQRCDAQY